MVQETTESKWYVVRVQSGREEQVRDALKRRVEAEGLGEEVTEVVVPTEPVTAARKVWSLP